YIPLRRSLHIPIRQFGAKDVSQLRLLIGIDAGDEKRVRTFPDNLANRNVFLLQGGPDGLDGLIRSGAYGIVRNNLQDEFDPTLQVQSEMDAILHMRNARRESCEEVNAYGKQRHDHE